MVCLMYDKFGEGTIWLGLAIEACGLPEGTDEVVDLHQEDDETVECVNIGAVIWPVGSRLLTWT